MKFNLMLIQAGIGLLFSLPLTAQLDVQGRVPGGVKGLQHWYSLANTAEQTWEWRDKVNKTVAAIAVPDDQITYINGNPALDLNRQEEQLRLPIDPAAMHQSTIITLYQAQDSFAEQIIWRISDLGNVDLVLSTDRLGDVGRGRYFTNPAQNELHPILHTYVQHDRSKVAVIHAQWHIGHVGDKENLPLAPFQGALAELLVFDRVLSATELKRIHSHLAIQYGISLPFTDYLDSSEELIWEFEENRAFPYRITGIMHDPLSGLHQKRSRTQMSADKLFELSVGPWTATNAANEQSLTAGASLVWSDNGERLRFLSADSETASAPLLERRWSMTVRSGGEEVATSIRLHTRNLEKLVRTDQAVWLAVDQSGSGNFSYADTEYYPVSESQGELLLFEDVHWDQDHSGSDIFTFVLGEPMIPVVAIEQPQCDPGRAGKMTLKVHGGLAPYSIRWMKDGKANPRFWNLDASEELTWSVAEAGYYELRIEDANGQVMYKKVSLQNLDAPTVELVPQYTLSSNQPLVISLGDDLAQGTTVQWTLPDGRISKDLVLRTAIPGEYLVRVEMNGCAKTQRFEVLSPPESFVEEWQLFPNPVGSNEDFDLRVSLREPQWLEIRLLDQSGRLLATERKAPAAFHTYKNRLPVAGIYKLVLNNGREQISLPIVVQ